MSPGRLLFRAMATVYAVVLMAVVRQQPLEVAGSVSGLPTDSLSSWTSTVVMLGAAGLAVVAFLSAVGSVARARSTGAEDIYLVGVVAMVLLCALLFAVARNVTDGSVGSGAWGGILMALLVAGLVGLTVVRARGTASSTGPSPRE